MTPAINKLKKAKISFTTHSYKHDPVSKAYGEQAAKKLNIPPEQVFKTLVVQSENNKFYVAIVPVSHQLDLKKLSKSKKIKKVKMADKKKVESYTGYVLGGVSPIGQKKKLDTIIDRSALNFDTIHVSAGRRGLQVELSPNDLADLISAEFFDISKY